MSPSRFSVVALVVLIAVAPATAAPPVIEISAARPLFVFKAPDWGSDSAADYAARLTEVWNKLPPSLHTLSVFAFDASGDSIDLVEMGFVLARLRDAGIPVSLKVASQDRALSISVISDLLAANPNILLVQAENPPLSTAQVYGGIVPAEPSPGVRWVLRALDLAAANGRLLSLRLDAASWLRILSDPAHDPVYQGLRYYAPNTILIHPMENPTVVTTTGALLGLWIEGAGDNWGVSMSPEWFRSTDFVSPGHWGARDGAAHAPPSIYRAMILAGAMAGATVYRFEDPQDLWFGDRGYQWAESIVPTLREVVDMGIIPRRDLVAGNCSIAYQCGTTDSPALLSTILDETNAALGNGGLERVVYGVFEPRDEPDLFPNRATNYFVPLLSRNAPLGIAGQFENVVTAGLGYTDDEWTKLIQSMGTPEPEGTATIVRVGRSIFALHNRENGFERQTFRIPDMPAPVRGVKARRTDSGIELSWPFRENDFAYTVYRRVLPELTYEPVAIDLDERVYLDASVSRTDTVAYALAALTNEPEPIEGSVNWGEYHVFSAAISRIEEEVIVLPETEIAISAPVPVIDRDFPDNMPIWPAISGLSDSDTAIAMEVAERIELLRRAIMVEDAEYVGGLFAREYQGADGSNAAFAGHFLAAFLEKYDLCNLFVQAQDWFVENTTEPRVTVTVYMRLSGVAHHEGMPRVHSVPAEDSPAARLKFAMRDGDWRIISADSPFPSLSDFAP